MGCVLVALVAPSGQLRQPQKLVRELSGCEALRGCPKVFLMLSSAPGGEWLGRDPHFGAGQIGVGRRLRLSLQANTVLFYPAAPKPGAFLTVLGELCGRCSHWSLLQLLTEVGAPDESQGGGCAGGLP